MASSRLLARARRRLDRIAGRFARADDGATAVEFAIVVMPFLVLVFGLIELGLVSLVSMSLDNAVMETGRTIRTGQVQTSGGTAATFKTSVCNQMSWLGSKCASSLSIDVRTFNDYASSKTNATTGA